jgi:GNAT superfamily N-acetyltransferase
LHVVTATPSGSSAVAAAYEPQRLRDGGRVWLRATAAPADDGAAIAAFDADGRTVGRAAYTRVYGPRADVALELDEAFWHRGLAELLLATLCVRAACVGISTFLARVPASDLRLLALLRTEFSARGSRDGSHVDVDFATAATPSGRNRDEHMTPAARPRAAASPP